MRKDFLQDKGRILKEMENLNAYTRLWRQQGIRIPGRETELCANVEVCRERGSPEEGQVPRRNTRQAELATQGERGGLGHLREKNWCTRERHHDVNALVCGDRCVETGVSDAS